MSLSSKTVDMEDGGKQFLTIYLHGEGLLLDYDLKAAGQVGLWVLRLLAGSIRRGFRLVSNIIMCKLASNPASEVILEPPKAPRFRFGCAISAAPCMLQLHDSYSRIAFSPH